MAESWGSSDKIVSDSAVDFGADDKIEGAPKPAGAIRKLADLGLSAVKGVIAVPEAAVGLADLATGGRAGKAMEGVGVRFKDAKDVLTGFQSDDLKGKQQEFQQADGILAKTGVALSNPGLIANTVAESVPLMGAGVAPARAALALAPRIGAIGAGAIGEGVVGAGSAAESTRQETADGLLTGKQAALSAASGAATGAIGAVGGKLAGRFGDVDSMLAKGSLDAVQSAKPVGLVGRVAGGAATEGAEELGQSVSEQALQNVALDKPITQGLEDAAVMGTLAGGVMGAGAGALTRQPTASTVDPLAAPTLAQPDVTPAPTRSQAMGINPANGPIQAAAAIAVDSGASATVLQQAAAQADQSAGKESSKVDSAANQPQTQADAPQTLEGGKTLGSFFQENLPSANDIPANVNPSTGEIITAFDQRQQDAPQTLPTDILTIDGVPFNNHLQAKKAAIEAGPEYAPFKLGTRQFVVRKQEVQDVSPSSDVQPVDSGADGAGSDIAPAGVGAGVGNTGAGERAVDTGGDGNQPVAVSAPLATRNVPLSATTRPQPTALGTQTNVKAGPGFGAKDVITPPPAQAIDEAANTAATSPLNDLPQPTDGQKEAGNYKKGHVNLNGLDITIESPRGSSRSGKRPDGSTWSHDMSDHYGYIKSTTGADNEQVDVYVGPKPDSANVFVVDQIDQQTGGFDEHKAMLGYANQMQAMKAYRSNFDKGWKVGPVKTMTTAEFKTWLKEGETKQPLAFVKNTQTAIKSESPQPQEKASEPKAEKSQQEPPRQQKAGQPAAIDQPAASAPVADAGQAASRKELVGKKRGDFYEIEGDNAKEVSRILNLTLTKTREGAPTVGWPYHAHERMVGELADAGLDFKDADQTPAPVARAGLAKMRAAKAAKEAAATFSTPESVAKAIQEKVASNRRKSREKSRKEREVKGYAPNSTPESEQAGYDEEISGQPSEIHMQSAAALLGSDPRPLIEMFVRGQYEASEDVFKDITGVKILGLSVADKKAALYKWANWTPEQIAQAEDVDKTRQDKREAEYKQDNLKGSVRSAWFALKDLKVKGPDGTESTGQDFILKTITNGFDKAHSQKKGVALIYGLTNGKNFTTLKGGALTKFVKAAIDFGGMDKAIEYVNPPKPKAPDFVVDRVVSIGKADKDDGLIAKAFAPTEPADQPAKRSPEADHKAAMANVAKRRSEQAQAAAKPDNSVKPEAKPAAKIEDSGQVLEGARKLYAKAYRAKLDESMGVDIASVPLSKSWPEPDYQKLIDEGADPWAVAFAHAARDEVPTKPAKSWKLKGWVEKVQSLRHMTAKMMEGVSPAYSKEKIIQKLKTTQLQNFGNKADLYEAVGHENSLKEYTFSRGEYSMHGGETFSPAKVLWAITQPSKSASATWSHGNWGYEIAVADTKEEAVRKFKAWSEAQGEKAPEAAKSVVFDIYTYSNRPGEFVVGKRISASKSIDLKTFPTAKEARAYKTGNQAELEDLLAKAKFEPTERRESNAPRVGADYRNGADVTTDQFRETFGFRGEQFGASMPQGERQANMNQAYDALLDLAGVVGIPPKALSLNGELGLAFGARGNGGKNPAAAHYEADLTGAVAPNRVVINLTRKNGAGSLAHEWFHAVDNYFARMRGQKAGFVTEYADTWRGDGMRPEMLAAFKELMKTINLTGIRERSKVLDAKRTKDYWGTGLEMAARSFESYVIAKLQDQNQSNDYLANIVNETLYALQGAYPYPSMGEMPQIRAAFDHFFDVVQTKETATGVALFNTPDSEYTIPNGSRPEQSTAATEADIELLARSVSPGKRFGDVPPFVSRPINSFLLDGRVLGELAGALGSRIAGFATNPVLNPLQQAQVRKFNGVYLNGTIYIREGVDRPNLAVLGHEFGHLLQDKRPDLYAKLVEAVRPYVKDKEYAAFKDSPVAKGLTDPKAIREEFIGEVLSDGFMDKNFWKTIGEKNPSLLGQLIDALAGLIDTIKAKVGYTSRTQKYLSDYDAVIKIAGEVAAEMGVKPQFSQGPVRNPTTVAALQQAVRQLTGVTGNLPNQLGRVVATTSAEIKSTWEPLIGRQGLLQTEDPKGDALAFFDLGTKTVFLLADRITAGDETAILAHELMHKHGQAVLGKEGWDRLHGVIGTWENARKGSDERSVYDYAKRRIDAVGQELSNQELFPYAVEAAIKLGIKPNAIARQGTVARWLAEVMRSMKAAWEKIVGKPETFKAQDLMNLAYGIAQMENPAHASVAGFRGTNDTMTAFDNASLGKNPNEPTAPDSGGAPAFSRSIGDTLKGITVTDIKTRTGNKLADYRNLGLQFLGGRQIVDLYAKDLPQLNGYTQMVQQMSADANEVGAQADGIVTGWAKLKDERQLAELMHDATLAQIDPAKDFVTGDNRMQWGSLNAKFKALSDEAKTVYTQARDAYEEHYAQVREAIRDKIERSEMTSASKAAMLERMDGEFFDKIKGVYFPLARFGKYVVVTRGAGGNVVNVSRAETLNEAEATRDLMRKTYPAAQGFAVGKVIKDKEFNAARDSVSRGFLKELFGVLDEKGMGKELQDAVNQLYLASMPDLSWAKHGIHRKGTPGFSQDARRAFAQNMFHGARYLAKLRYADQLQDKLTGMQNFVESKAGDEAFDSVKAQQVVDELNKRHESLMNPKSNPLSTALTSFGFVFHMGLSPASAMVNLSGTAMVAYPIMGAKWGFDKAASALMTAAKQAATHKNDISAALNDDEKRAYEAAVKAGTIDVTAAHDLAGIAQGEDTGVMWKMRPVMKWASFLFHHAERFNRQVTFVAAYRLARGTGAAHEAAFEQATKATYDGHFDYASSNRPRVMQGNAAKVLLLFKQYGQNVVYTLARQAQLAMKAETPEGRKEARKALGGLLVMHAAGAGVLGLPLVGTLLAAASMLGGSDDEPWDAETALRNMLADTFGQKPAEVMARGFSRLTPFDISGRIGLNHLILPDIQEGLEGQRLGESAMAAALGPVAGIGINLLKGMQEISEGHMARGLESMMPTALRGPMKALRYAQEGAKDKTGIVIQDEVGVAGIAGQALGFSPSEVRNATEGRSAIFSADKRLMERRKELTRQFSDAYLDNDQESVAKVREAIQAFNEKNPSRRIGGLQLMQSVRAKAKRVSEAEQGVYLPKKRRDALEEGRFAQVD